MNSTPTPPSLLLDTLADALEAAANELRRAAAAQPPVPVEVSTDGKLLLTITEAAERLSIGRSLAYQLVQSGDLPTVQLGRRRLVPTAALQKMVTDALRP